ncbi:MAG: hypothetical protein A2X94_03140 [Bdellovibrionales bacterium GWB1_55_8]|nr:MAG: hypothetical protein A2X94_03140 [Bdellovibrionales bacterium GWB1_55_8]
MTNGKILATGDLKTGEITRNDGNQNPASSDLRSASASPAQADADTALLKKKLKEFGFVEQDFPADGSFTFTNKNLAN